MRLICLTCGDSASMDNLLETKEVSRDGRIIKVHVEIPLWVSSIVSTRSEWSNVPIMRTPNGPSYTSVRKIATYLPGGIPCVVCGRPMTVLRYDIARKRYYNRHVAQESFETSVPHPYAYADFGGICGRTFKPGPAMSQPQTPSNTNRDEMAVRNEFWMAATNNYENPPCAVCGRRTHFWLECDTGPDEFVKCAHGVSVLMACELCDSAWRMERPYLG